MNDFFEFFFCPIHGIFRPQMWPFIGVGITAARVAMVKCRESYIAEFLYCQIHGLFRHREQMTKRDKNLITAGLVSVSLLAFAGLLVFINNLLHPSAPPLP